MIGVITSPTSRARLGDPRTRLTWTRAEVVETARTWTSTPWVHQAYLKGVGADCIGLIGGVALELGLPGAETWRDTPEFHNYGRQPDPEVLIAGCELLMEPIQIADAMLADVLVMRFKKEPQHFAILSERDGVPYIIHALMQAEKVTEARLDHIWRKRIVAAYHLRGVI